MSNPPQDVTAILQAWSDGDTQAPAKLMPLVYEELRRLARDYLRGERLDHTLQPTALVHEAFLRMVDQSSMKWQNRAHFYGLSAQLMRHILVDHARARVAAKRGGVAQKVPFDDAKFLSTDRPTDLIALDDALKGLAEIYPRKSQVVELKFFGGLSVEEIAEILQVTAKTVSRDWNFARLWLYREVAKTQGDEST